MNKLKLSAKIEQAIQLKSCKASVQFFQHSNPRSVCFIAVNGSSRGVSPRMASNRTASFDCAQTPSISLEKQMHNEEENLLKEWDTTVRCRQENSLSIRPISLSAEDAIRISGLKVKPRVSGGSTSKTSSTVDLASSGAVRFEFPEIDIVKRHDTSLDDSAENVEDDSRRFTYTECPTTGHKTMRLEMNVEGFDPKDITVKSFGGRLTVHGITYDVHDGKKSTNEFCRKIKLPDGVSSENLRCTFCDHILVLEAPVRTRCSTPDVTGRHPLNHPVILFDENGRYLSLVVELGRIFRPSDVVVKVKGQQTICIFADAVENTTFSRMKAKLEREFDLPEKIDQKSLRAGCTEDRLLKIVARIRDPNEQAVPQKAVRIDVGDSVS